MLGFASGHRNRFHAQIAEHGDDHAQPHAPDAFGPEAAADLVVLQPYTWNAGAKHHVGADQHKSHNGGHLDGRESVFHRAIDFDAAQVHADQNGGEDADPDPLRYIWEPVGHVHADRRDFHADSQHQGGPVGIAQHKTSQRPEIKLGIGAKGAGCGVGHRHFAQAANQEQGDEGANGVADEHGRAGKANGKGAAHEQTGADGAANGDHDHLGTGQVLLQAGFALLNTVKVGHAPSVLLLSKTGKYRPYCAKR